MVSLQKMYIYKFKGHADTRTPRIGVCEIYTLKKEHYKIMYIDISVLCSS